MNVLSLFDGMSCCQIALNRLGIIPDKYFASEVDKFAMQVTMANFPNTIQIGDVRNVNGKDLGFIDLLAGGSPCQSFSFAGKRKGMATTDNIEILTLNHYLELKSQNFEFEGQSYLFWEYMRILEELRTINPNIKFLLENVVMGEKWQKILTKAIGINPIKINSSLVSAQNRKRLYWINIASEPVGFFGDLVCSIPQPKDKGILLKDILETDVADKYFLSGKMINGLQSHSDKKQSEGCGFKFEPTTGNKKSKILTTKQGQRIGDNYIVAMRGRNPENPKSRVSGLETEQQLEPRNDGKTNCLTSVQKDNLVQTQSNIRRLTPTECERLQTVPDGYSDFVSDSQRYKMLGNGWTINVIVHIFSYFKL